MQISEAAKKAAKEIVIRVREFEVESSVGCITEECYKKSECINGYCVLGMEMVQEQIQDAIYEATAEKDREIERLRGLIGAMYTATIDRPLTDKQHKYLMSIMKALAGGEEKA